MATRKRHIKTQFVIPEEVQAPVQTGWTYKTDASQQPRRSAPLLPLESGLRALTYGAYAVSEMFVFTMQVATLPVTIAGRMFRG